MRTIYNTINSRQQTSGYDTFRERRIESYSQFSGNSICAEAQNPPSFSKRKDVAGSHTKDNNFGSDAYCNDMLNFCFITVTLRANFACDKY